jgi:hypothetical protein
MKIWPSVEAMQVGFCVEAMVTVGPPVPVAMTREAVPVQPLASVTVTAVSYTHLTLPTKA